MTALHASIMGHPQSPGDGSSQSPANVVASVKGVAGAGFRLSLILNAVSCEVANAPLEIHHISKTVTLFALMLKQTGTVLQATDSVHSSEAIETAQQVAHESTLVFDEINEMLDKVTAKRTDGGVQPSVQQRFKQYFKKGRISYLVAQLESLKLSLSLMLQILQLGKLMASTSKSDTPEQVKINTARIQQERAEAQNTVIIRHIQIGEVDRLFYRGDQIDEEIGSLSPSSDSSRLTIEPPPEEKQSTALIKLPVHTLGDVDKILTNLQSSSKDMVRSSAQAIDPLLEKWTRWHEVREKRHRKPEARHTPQVDALTEDERETTLGTRYSDRDASSRGYYLEGVTTDWRRPHSVEARREAAARRKKYSGYQPSVSLAGTDVEDSPDSTSSKRARSTKRHIINSSPESSDSEAEPQKRRDSVLSGQANRPKQTMPEGTPALQKTVSATPRMTSAAPPAPPTMPAPVNRSAPSPYVPAYMTQGPAQRPLATPDQQKRHHSISSPLPPIETWNAPNPYANTPTSPAYQQISTYAPAASQSRQYDRAAYPARQPPRPVSRDGPLGGRSPSRLAYEGITHDHARTRDQRYDSRDPRRGDPRRSQDKGKNLREGAAKGLIGAGAIAGFLEALEGLSL